MKDPQQTYFKTSLAQQKVLEDAKGHNGLIRNNRPVFIQVNTSNLLRLNAAVNKLIARHEFLRTAFLPAQGGYVQDVKNEFVYTICDHPVSEPFIALEELKKNKKAACFHQDSFPLFEFSLHHLNQNEKVLIFNKPAFLSDSVSDLVLIKELETLYHDGAVEEVSFQYLDYILWQNDFIDSNQGLKVKEILTDNLMGDLSLIKNSFDYTGDYNSSAVAEQKSGLPFLINGSLLENINTLCQKHDMEIPSLFLAVWFVFLYKLTREDRVLISCVQPGRNKGWEKVTGNFESLIPVSSAVDGGLSFIDFWRDVQKKYALIKKYQYFPYNRLVEGTALSNNQLDEQISTIGFNFQSFEEEDKQKTVEWQVLDTERAAAEILVNSKINLEVIARQAQLSLFIHCDYALYEHEVIERFKSHIISALNCVIGQDSIFIDDINLLSPAETKTLLHEFNNPAEDVGVIKPIHVLFEEKALLFPDAVAVVHQNEELSYTKLNAQSNQLARLLREIGVKPFHFLAIHMERNPAFLIALIGIFKSGGAYVPVDRQNPDERAKSIINNSEAAVLFSDYVSLKTKKDLFKDLPFVKYVICPEETDADKSALEKLYNINIIDKNDYVHLSADHLENVNAVIDWSYMLYTSGSTGEPKGAILRHDGAVNHILAEYKFFELADGFSFLQSANISSDVSVWQLLAPLLKGGTVVIIDKLDLLDYDKVIEILNTYQVDIAEFVPSYLNSLADYMINSVTPPELPHLKWMMMTGEDLSVEVVKKWNKLHRSCKLVNAYGPCEASDDITQFIVADSFPADAKRIPVGKPLANMNIYVLDKNNALLPIGFTGEICVSGIGVGAGYWKDEEKTSQSFIENKFPGTTGDVIYKTGDSGKWLENGDLVFLGRLDNQIQIRGFRVETGEIDSVMRSHRKISDCITVAGKDSDGQDFLSAYLITKAQEDETFDLIKELRVFAGKYLPRYMVPAYFSFIRKFPKNLSDKIDLKRLPEVDTKLFIEDKFILPEGDIEIKIAAIWKDVLNVDNIGVDSNFFELGGHSLKAVKVISRIHKEVNFAIRLKDLFDFPTIRELSRILGDKEEEIYESIPLLTAQEYYNISSGQQRLWLIHQHRETKTAYNMSSAYAIAGDLKLPAFKEAMNLVIQRHEILRTRFITVHGEPKQVPDKFAAENFKLNFENLTDISDQLGAVNAICERLSATSFDLENGPLMKADLLMLRERQHLFVLTFHHIITDGWSIDVFIKEFITLYNAISSGATIELPALSIQYKDATAWINSKMLEESYGTHQAFWLDQFRDEIPVLNLPADYARPVLQTFNGSSVEEMLDRSVFNSLADFCKATGTTTFMVVFAAVKVLLYRYSGQHDIIIGTPSNGRIHPDLESQIGFYINTLPIRTKIDGDDSFDTLLKSLKNILLEAANHELYSFDNLVSDLNLEKDLGRSPLFDVMVVLQQSLLADELQMNGLVVEDYPIQTKASKFDLVFNFTETADSLSLNVEYNTDLYCRDRIILMMSHLVKLLVSVTQDSQQLLSAIDFMAEEEKKQILIEFNNTSTEYPDKDTLVSLFEAQAKANPDKTVVWFEDHSLTYRELDKLSNQLSFCLAENFQIRPGDFVGVYMSRSLEMIVAIWAILKTGAAYLPIDPDFPAERVKYMINDSRISTMLVNHKQDVNFECSQCVIDFKALGSYPAIPSVYRPSPENAAYVIYTSGSTGEPKGVVIEHRGAVNRIDWMWKAYSFSAIDVILQKTANVFDVSVWELFLPVCFGCSLVICPKDAAYDPFKLIKYIEDFGITTIHFVPTMYNSFLDSFDAGARIRLKSLRHIFSSGEALSVELANKHEKKSAIALHNLYGPTEASVDVSYYPVKKGDVTIPIGYPISNINLYVLDKTDRLLPIGIYGEICISGIGLAREYLNKPELSKEKFTENPYKPGERLYKTGDIGRWRKDGALEYLGRNDHQIKLKGYRIELGEIESALNKNKYVNGAAVLLDDDKSLVAYLICKDEKAIPEIRKELKSLLPDYMLPVSYVLLDSFPLTSSGKLDKKTLLKLKGINPEKEVKADATTAIEAMILNIWREVLGKEEIGIYDNFFEVGGDSIKAIQIATRLHGFKYKVEVKDLFEHPCIVELSKFLKPVTIRTDQAAVEGIIPMSQIQRDFFSRSMIHFNHYNQAVVLTGERFEMNAVKTVFARLMEHHDALRITFPKNNENFIQLNNGLNFSAVVDEYELKGDNYLLDYKLIADEFQAGLHLDSGPLLKVAIFHFPDGDRLLIVCHHLIIDGVSWRILLEDAEMLFKQYNNGDNLLLPDKTDSFKLWSEKIQEYAQSETLLSESKYWETLLANQNFQFPKDYNQSSGTVLDTKILSFSLTEEQTDLLITTVNQVFKSETNDILLAALMISCKEIYETDELLIALEGHGREAIIPNIDISRTIGWFTSVFPVVLKSIPVGNGFSEQIELIRTTLNTIPQKGIGFGILKYLSGLLKDLNSQPEIIFNYLGQFNAEVKDSNFKIASENPGQEINPEEINHYDLEIISMIADHKLQVSFHYNSKAHSSEKLSLLLTRYEQTLSRIIQESTQSAPAIEFTYKDISADTLAHINSLFN